MVDKKITDFDAQSATADTDVLASVDVSDTTDDVAGSSFKITFATLLGHYDALTATFTNKTFDANGTGNSITNIENADIAAAAAIAFAKLAALTDAQLLVGNSSNVATDVAMSGDATLANTGAVTVAGTHSGSAHHAAVTLSGTPDYITISGQVITRNAVVLTTDVSGQLPYANIADLTDAQFLVGNGSNVQTDVAMSGDATLANTGAVTVAGTHAGTAHHVAEPAASVTVAGIVELTVASEVNTGTSATLAVTPDSLAGSIHGEKTMYIKVIAETTVLTTGDSKAIVTIPTGIGGMNLVDAHAAVYGVSSSGLPTIQIHNLTDGSDMLSTLITIDTSEFSSYTAVTAPVIDGDEDDVVEGDRIRIDVDVAGTGTDGLDIILVFRTP